MSTQTPKRGDSKRDELIAGEYVLGILSADDRRKVEARIVLDSGFAAIVNRWRSNLATFDQIQEPTPPKPRPYSEIERRIFSPPPREKLGLWNSLPFWRTLAGLAVAGLAAIAILESARLAAPPTIAPAGTTVTTGKAQIPTGQ